MYVAAWEADPGDASLRVIWEHAGRSAPEETAVIAVAAAIAVSAIVGLLVVRAIGSEGSSWPSLAGESLLVGVGSTALVLQVVSMLGIPWSIPVAGIAIVAVCILLWIIGTRRGGLRASPGFQWRTTAIPFDVATLILIIGHAIFATLVRLPEHDFLAICGFEGTDVLGGARDRLGLPLAGVERFLASRLPVAGADVVRLRRALRRRMGRLDGSDFSIRRSASAHCWLRAKSFSRITRSPFLTSVATFALAGFALTPVGRTRRRHRRGLCPRGSLPPARRARSRRCAFDRAGRRAARIRGDDQERGRRDAGGIRCDGDRAVSRQVANRSSPLACSRDSAPVVDCACRLPHR